MVLFDLHVLMSLLDVKLFNDVLHYRLQAGSAETLFIWLCQCVTISMSQCLHVCIPRMSLA